MTRFEGIIPIPLTPFTEAGELDERALVRVVEFAVRTGGSALLSTVNASEWQALADVERQRITEITVAETRGEVPVIVGVTSVSTNLSVALARHAESVGAAAINSMPPRGIPLSDTDCFDFYGALAQAVELPIFIQNYYEPLGRPLSTALIRRIVETFPNVRYVKEETLPEPLQITRLLDAFAGSDSLEGVFGGQGGLYLVDEFERGSAGNMPATHVADAVVAVWAELRAGNLEEARQMHAQMLPLMTLERTWGGGPVYKEVLKRRGVISCTFRRTGGPDLDAAALRELDWALDHMSHLLTV